MSKASSICANLCNLCNLWQKNFVPISYPKKTYTNQHNSQQNRKFIKFNKKLNNFLKIWQEF